MKKIAFLIPSLRNVGPNIFTKNLVEALGSCSEAPEITVFYFRPFNGLTFPVETRSISSLQEAEAKSFDYFFSTMLRTDLWLAFGRHGIPTARRVSIIHNLYDEDVYYLYRSNALKRLVARNAWRLALKRIGQLIVSSPFMHSHYAEMLGGDVRISLIPYGITDPRQRAAPFRWQPQTSGERFILIGCGSLILRKNFAVVIRALSLLPEAHLRLIGSGPELGDLQVLAEKSGVANRVEFLGFRENLAQHLAQAHCFVMPSYSEGYGLALLEAIGLGMPVICSDLPIYRDMLPADAIPRFAPDDTTALVSALSLVRDNQLEFSKSTRELYLKIHQAGNMAKNFYDYIHSSNS